MTDILNQEIKKDAKVICIEKTKNSYGGTAHLVLGIVKNVTPKTCTVTFYNDNGTPKTNGYISSGYMEKTYRKESRSVLVHNW